MRETLKQSMVLACELATSEITFIGRTKCSNLAYAQKRSPYDQFTGRVRD